MAADDKGSQEVAGAAGRGGGRECCKRGSELKEGINIVPNRPQGLVAALDSR